MLGIEVVEIKEVWFIFLGYLEFSILVKRLSFRVRGFGSFICKMGLFVIVDVFGIFLYFIDLVLILFVMLMGIFI